MKHADEDYKEIVIDFSSDKWDTFFFIVIFLMVFLLLLPGFAASVPVPYNCSQNNGNFNACVSSQAAGKGCVWLAQCSVCAKEGSDVAKICQ